MSNLTKILSRRLKQKHTKLTQRFVKNLETGVYQTYSSRTRSRIINRLKKLERQLGLAKRHSYNVTFKHWAMALALGVVVTTASAQSSEKQEMNKRPTFKERLAKMKSIKSNTSARGEATGVTFTEGFQFGTPPPENTHIHDFDGDGDDDILYIPYVGGPFLMTNEGGLSFTKGSPQFVD